MFTTKHAPREGKVTRGAANKRSEREAARQRAQVTADRNIGDIPPPKDQARRDACEDDPERFLLTYFPERFPLEFSDDHRKAIALIERTIRESGLAALSMPRGSGKTTIVECMAIRAIVYGLHPFVVPIGSTGDAAYEMLQSVKVELDSNDLLAEDFPEVCLPIRELEDKAQRAKGQHQNGTRTFIRWGRTTVVLPRVRCHDGTWSKASEVVIRVAAITGRIRGMKYTRSTGEVIRPTLVIPDDPQTDDSAHSPLQCKRRLAVMNGAILKLAGPRRKMAGVCLLTVIRKGDMADRLLDRDASPQWHGQRCKRLYAFPERMDLWREYARLRADDLRADGNGQPARDFYAAQREEMDRGSQVAWPQRYEPGDLSALESIMIRFFEDPDSFWAEDQNEPRDEQVQEGDLTPAAIVTRFSGRARGLVPVWASKLTAMIDVQQSLLYWLVCAWKADDFTGAVIDYGAWPEQPGRRYFTLADAEHTLQLARPGIALQAQLAGGLADLIFRLTDRTFPSESGAGMRVERMLVDSGFEMDTVFESCRPFAPKVLPSRGQPIGAKNLPMSEFRTSPNGIRGFHWLEDVQRDNKRALRWVRVDGNFWKSFAAAALLCDAKAPGALTLFGSIRQEADHDMISEQLCAEKGTIVEAHGRKVVEWELKPGRPDNHFLDCLTGAYVAASMSGVQAAGQQAKTVPGKRLTLEQLKNGHRRA